MLRMPRGSLAQRQLATGQLARGDQVCDGDFSTITIEKQRADGLTRRGLSAKIKDSLGSSSTNLSILTLFHEEFVS